MDSLDFYSETPEGEIYAITPGEDVGTWNVFVKGQLAGVSHSGAWTPAMVRYLERRDGVRA